jgi:hypothetical protein
MTPIFRAARAGFCVNGWGGLVKRIGAQHDASFTLCRLFGESGGLCRRECERVLRTMRVVSSLSRTAACGKPKVLSFAGWRGFCLAWRVIRRRKTGPIRKASTRLRRVFVAARIGGIVIRPSL